MKLPVSAGRTLRSSRSLSMSPLSAKLRYGQLKYPSASVGATVFLPRNTAAAASGTKRGAGSAKSAPSAPSPRSFSAVYSPEWAEKSLLPRRYSSARVKSSRRAGTRSLAAQAR